MINQNFKLEPTNSQQITNLQLDFSFDLLAIEECAIAAVQIVDESLPVFQQNRTMMAAD